MVDRIERIDGLEVELKLCIASIPLDIGCAFMGAAAREIAGPQPDQFMTGFIAHMDNPRRLYRMMAKDGMDQGDIQGMFAAMVTAHCDWARGIRPDGSEERIKGFERASGRDFYTGEPTAP